MKIEELNFSVRTYNILKRAGFNTVEQLQQLTDDELVCIRNLGRNSLGEIHEKLERYAMTNADHIRSMTDEELAWELMTWRIETAFRLQGVESDYPYTQKTILEWLKQPYKENEE